MIGPVNRPRSAILALVLIVGVTALGMGAIFSRAAYDAVGAGTLGAGLLLALVRLALTSLLTAPAWFRSPPTGAVRWGQLSPATRRRMTLAGVLLGLHFATWLPSLAYTSVAASVTIVTTAPVWIALLLWRRGQRPTSRAMAGIAIAILGGTLVAFGTVDGLDSGANPLLGNALALVAAIVYAGYLLIGHDVQREGLGLWRWTSAVAGVGALTVLPLALLTAPSDGPYPAGFWLAAVALALVPQMLGHSTFTWSMRWLTPTLASVIILLEPLVSSLGALVLFDEVPGLLVVTGGVVLIAGVGLTVLAERGLESSPEADPVIPA
jgi:drug/metabolite transporter (DMT)-like permease